MKNLFEAAELSVVRLILTHTKVFKFILLPKHNKAPSISACRPKVLGHISFVQLSLQTKKALSKLSSRPKALRIKKVII